MSYKIPIHSVRDLDGRWGVGGKGSARRNVEAPFWVWSSWRGKVCAERKMEVSAPICDQVHSSYAGRKLKVV